MWDLGLGGSLTKKWGSKEEEEVEVEEVYFADSEERSQKTSRSQNCCCQLPTLSLLPQLTNRKHASCIDCMLPSKSALA